MLKKIIALTYISDIYTDKYEGTGIASPCLR